MHNQVNVYILSYNTHRLHHVSRHRNHKDTIVIIISRLRFGQVCTDIVILLQRQICKKDRPLNASAPLALQILNIFPAFRLALSTTPSTLRTRVIMSWKAASPSGTVFFTTQALRIPTFFNASALSLSDSGCRRLRGISLL